jgi:hypothetical protein
MSDAASDPPESKTLKGSTMDSKARPVAPKLTVAFIVGMLTTGHTAMAQSSGNLATDTLVGRWGVAAYWNESDATKVVQQARSFCSKPYVIGKGRNGGAMMYEAFHGRPQEVRVSGRQIAPMDGSTQTSKTISSWDGKVLIFSYDDAEAKRRYGNMVFVRCT